MSGADVSADRSEDDGHLQQAGDAGRIGLAKRICSQTEEEGVRDRDGCGRGLRVESEINVKEPSHRVMVSGVSKIKSPSDFCRINNKFSYRQ